MGVGGADLALVIARAVDADHRAGVRVDQPDPEAPWPGWQSSVGDRVVLDVAALAQFGHEAAHRAAPGAV
jgi:hypothetical protein